MSLIEARTNPYTKEIEELIVDFDWNLVPVFVHIDTFPCCSSFFK